VRELLETNKQQKERRTMTRQEIFEKGFDRGFSIASWMELPRIGDNVPKELDWIGIEKVESVSDAGEVFIMYCQASEDNGRSYSPFEFTAKELNNLQEELDESEGEWFDVWEVYEDGIEQGFLENWQQRSKDFYTTEEE
jgi:hypothetical protein